MSLQVITNILNDYLSLEQEDKEAVLRLLLETEDEDDICPCCELEGLLEEASVGNLHVTTGYIPGDPVKHSQYKDDNEVSSTTSLDQLWTSYVNSMKAKGGVARL